ncbi:MAG: FkbM family methyltransferase [Methylocystis sp.]|uniref:FkbM family methyltransferase n=1 Tax=Methylocystis sp. TaxID=1911079 RepID=UPI003DA5ACE9
MIKDLIEHLFWRRSSLKGQQDFASLSKGIVLTIIDVGAQKLNWEDHIYDPICTPRIKHRIIGFEALEERAFERSDLGEKDVTIHPVAVGDGLEHTLYVNNDDATSSLFPLNEELCNDFEHLCTLKTVATKKITTSRLDDLIPDCVVDFLKLDIQGGELLALESGRNVLERTAVVHCEVEFDQIYRGQPLFSDISTFMHASGFYLVDLIIPHRYSYENADQTKSPDRLLWAEAVFFKKTSVARLLRSQALIAALVYNKPTLAAHLANGIQNNPKRKTLLRDDDQKF